MAKELSAFKPSTQAIPQIDVVGTITFSSSPHPGNPCSRKRTRQNDRRRFFIFLKGYA